MLNLGRTVLLKKRTLRSLALIGLILGVSFLSISAKTNTYENPMDIEYRKDNVPWPWGKEIDFPWREAPGVYSILLEERKVFLSLNVVAGDAEPFSSFERAKPRPSYVKIHLTDAATCMTMGIGRGFKVGHLIRAQFVNQFDNEVYTISLHTFDEAVAKMSGVFTNSKDMVMVASVGLLKQNPQGPKIPMMTSPLIRVANPSESCELIQKKLEKGL